MKVIISDTFLRKSFDVFNIVKRNFGKCKIILTSEKDSMMIQVKSHLIFGKRVELLRKREVGLFKHDLYRISSKYQDEIMVFLPVEEDTTELFLSLVKLNSIPDNIKYLLPEYDIFQLSRDKFRLQEYCENLGFSVPEKFTIAEALKLTPFKKLIIKPRSGSGSKGIKYINNKSELDNIELLNENNFVIQEQLENTVNVIGAFFLCKNGEVIISYCHKRIRTSPPKGGVTVYSKIVVNEEVERIGEKLLKSLKWNGLVMIEFLFDGTDNKYKIIEINPRIWGSILLSEFADSEMMKSYINLSANKNYVIKDTKTYIQTDRYIRWIIPYDLKQFFSDFFKGHLKDKRTCYINFTYAGYFSAISFLLFSIFSFSNVKKLLSKIKKQ